MATTTPEQTYNKVRILFQQQRFAEALMVLDNAEHAEDANCLYARIRCLTKMRRLDEARKACERLRDAYNDSRVQKLLDKLDALETRMAAAASAAAKPAATQPPAKAPQRKRALKIVVGVVLAAVVIAAASGGLAAYRLLTPAADTPLIEGGSVPADIAVSTAKEAKPEGKEGSSSEKPAEAPAPRRNGPQLRLRGLDLYDVVAKEEQDAGTPLGDVAPSGAPEVSTGAAKNGGDAGQIGLSMAVPANSEERDGVVLASAAAAIAAPAIPSEGAFHFPTQSQPFAPVDSVMGLQPFKTAQRIANTRGDAISLTNVNPNVGSWYVMDVNVGGVKNTLHIEVAALHGEPASKPKLTLYSDGLTVTLDGEAPRPFPFWASTNPVLANAAPPDATQLNPEPNLADVLKPGYAFSSPLTAICGGYAYVRVQKAGSATKLEIATDLLRETRLGDWFVANAKPYLIAAPELGDDHRATSNAAHAPGEAYPFDALIEESQADLYLSPPNLDIATDAANNRYYYGRWYKAANHPYVFVGMMKPTIVEKRLMDSYSDRVGAIGIHDKGRRESDALVYLIAFDLSKFRFGYALGAEHPKLDWSTKTEFSPKTGKGPDGFDSRAPLSTVGAVPPYYDPWVVGAFVGGFKREHGAFRTGPLAKVNSGSHFGFMEQGAVFSRLLPALATVAISRDGGINLFTWPEDGSGLLPQLAHARQNCVSIVEGMDANGISIPNPLVNDWGGGSWSGDQNGNCVTLRTGLAVQEFKGNRFLIFAYFTGATPNAMARVFQAYQCRYGMLLDMNTPNYCYATLYNRDADGKVIGAEYLHKEMKAGDGNDGSLKFLQRNDTRDFFYVLKRY